MTTEPDASTGSDTSTPDQKTPTPPAAEKPMPTTTTKPARTTVTKLAPKTATDSKAPWIWGLGRRKSSVARVRIRPGKGEFLINKRKVEDYLNSERDRQAIAAPLKATQSESSVDVFVNVRGGGTTGQTGAIVLGVARALLKADPALDPILREHGYLTRDSREVERKKYGQRGARRRFQFSKR